MPQLRLEFSSNILEKSNLTHLFQECHVMLEKMLPTNISTCKSRATECATFYVGDGNPQNAFVHVSLKVLPGREAEILKNVGETMMGLLQKHFAHSLQALKLQITLELMELEKTYFKFASQNVN
jgi:5-carboxymethyl-2-hydroxymuconate isomerase